MAGRLHDGVLADVAPTLLELVGVPPAEGMTGQSLMTDLEQPPQSPAGAAARCDGALLRSACDSYPPRRDKPFF